ncbi:LLM class F420-dependent oxidoreductase [Prescottella agglutinans]|uniref:LLM class F420-dependent oxidoreductase n=1 Tax=Prescottella agglutinans TaxID=1644129 RepID=A0A438BHR7_9NOCA|nr:LLM class F420-dependent oxidoreductase [Prescottella agglutinans]RVW10633.1 LLM class F420-dependent oxidoreductase [Prescottella agglutinans]
MAEVTAQDSVATPTFGRFGVWRAAYVTTPKMVAEIERLGYGAIWAGGSPPADLQVIEDLIAGTEKITVATGIVNIFSAPADEIAKSYQRIESRHPGRFVLGIGVGHPEVAGMGADKPYDALVRYLDVLDDAGVPKERRVLAALGPKVLRLAADRSAGAHPYLTPPEHTRQAREILGPDALLAPEQKVVLSTDSDAARAIGREAVENPYLHLRNYRRNLERLGFRTAELDNGGSDRVIDALVAHGDATTVAARLTAHLDVGADHVAIQVLPMAGEPLPALRELAAQLGVGG